ncbi:serine/threonine-protein kinase [Actinokineospora pegani]|uniref:serine/threonine-protein kinase n=1 Tax=Actinokineospora pegani TaxID=2654637 RepID=UPI001F2828C0|nr:serine/threonine-protein kinase [Actinokineospora pegani]
MTQEQGPAVTQHGRQPGQRVVAGRYVVQSELGRGGMGVVWLAEDRMIGRQVAIKELHLPDGVPHAERKVFEERVLREARTAGRLNDPAVVTVYDVVQEAGATYIVMELIQAPTLSDVVKERGPLPQDQVAVLAEQLLSALEAAHQAGIVHRDVKPSNIMLARNGRVKLTDFGIAQSLDDPRLTSSGMLIGSPTYMAPERIRGEEAQGSSDLWALGAVLFFAVEGYSPFERTTTAATMHAILAEVPYLTRAQGALASIITGLMNGTPQGRLTGPQVRSLLGHVRNGPPSGPVAAHSGPVPTQTHYIPPTPPNATHLVAAGQGGRVRTKTALVIAGVLAVVGLVAGIFLREAFIPSADAENVVQTYSYGPGGDLTEFELREGYCSNNPLQMNAGYSSSGSDCDKPHKIEVFGSFSPLSTSYDLTYNGDRVKGAAEGFCTWLFNTERVDPTKHADGKLAFAVVYPSQAVWEDDDISNRYETFCVVYDPSGAFLTKTVLTKYSK